MMDDACIAPAGGGSFSGFRGIQPYAAKPNANAMTDCLAEAAN